jgi:hypothetical protein
MKFTISKTVAVALLTIGLVASSFGGGVTIYWLNDGNIPTAATADPLYLGSNAPVALSGGGTLTTGDGYLIQLVALLGGTNFVLASATVGDTPGNIQPGPWNGYFDVYSPISVDVLNAVYNDNTTPMGVVFYAGTNTSAPSALVYNNSIKVPNPQASGTFNFDLKYSDLNFMGPRTELGSPKGWFIEVPEPSTMILVGLGLLGAVGLRRRHRS